MRSRYTAFTKADTDYLIKTMQGAPLQDFDPKSIKAWAQNVSRMRLTVLRTTISDNEIGTVEFIANFKKNGQSTS